MSTKNISQTSPLEFFDEEPIMPCDETCPLDIIAKEVVEEEMNNYKETWKRIAQDESITVAYTLGSPYMYDSIITSRAFISEDEFEIGIPVVISEYKQGTKLIKSTDGSFPKVFLTKEEYGKYVEESAKKTIQAVNANKTPQYVGCDETCKEIIFDKWLGVAKSDINVVITEDFGVCIVLDREIIKDELLGETDQFTITLLAYNTLRKHVINSSSSDTLKLGNVYLTRYSWEKELKYKEVLATLKNLDNFRNNWERAFWCGAVYFVPNDGTLIKTNITNIIISQCKEDIDKLYKNWSMTATIKLEGENTITLPSYLLIGFSEEEALSLRKIFDESEDTDDFNLKVLLGKI